MQRRLPPALRIRDFALLWASLFSSGVAFQMLAVAIGWQVYSIHRNPLDLELVPHELLPGALALRGVAGQIGLITGPALGGIIFAVEPVAVYAAAAGLLTLSLAAVLAMRPVVRSLVTTEPPGWDSLVAGVRFIFRTRMLLGAIGLDLFGVLLGDSIALAPVFAQSILHVGPVGLGLLRTAPSVGALVAALLLTRKPLHTPAGPTLLVVVGTF